VLELRRLTPRRADHYRQTPQCPIFLPPENKDADEAHGQRFQAEMQRLMAAGAYNNLL